MLRAVTVWWIWVWIRIKIFNTRPVLKCKRIWIRWTDAYKKQNVRFLTKIDFFCKAVFLKFVIIGRSFQIWRWANLTVTKITGDQYYQLRMNQSINHCDINYNFNYSIRYRQWLQYINLMKLLVTPVLNSILVLRETNKKNGIFSTNICCHSSVRSLILPTDLSVNIEPRRCVPWHRTTLWTTVSAIEIEN